MEFSLINILIFILASVGLEFVYGKLFNKPTDYNSVVFVNVGLLIFIYFLKPKKNNVYLSGSAPF
jgi:hypothetical protein